MPSVVAALSPRANAKGDNQLSLAVTRNATISRSAMVLRARGIAGQSLDIDARCECIFLNELTARLDNIAHQLGKDVVGFGQVTDVDL